MAHSQRRGRLVDIGSYRKFPGITGGHAKENEPARRIYKCGVAPSHLLKLGGREIANIRHWNSPVLGWPIPPSPESLFAREHIFYRDSRHMNRFAVWLGGRGSSAR
jgi:hypothetical protein